jgi:hypothetical protein
MEQEVEMDLDTLVNSMILFDSEMPHCVYVAKPSAVNMNGFMHKVAKELIKQNILEPDLISNIYEYGSTGIIIELLEVLDVMLFVGKSFSFQAGKVYYDLVISKIPKEYEGVKVEFTNIPLNFIQSEEAFITYATSIGQPMKGTIPNCVEYPKVNLISAYLLEGFGNARTNRGIAYYNYMPEVLTLSKRMSGYIWPQHPGLANSNGPRFKILGKGFCKLCKTGGHSHDRCFLSVLGFVSPDLISPAKQKPRPRKPELFLNYQDGSVKVYSDGKLSPVTSPVQKELPLFDDMPPTVISPEEQVINPPILQSDLENKKNSNLIGLLRKKLNETKDANSVISAILATAKALNKNVKKELLKKSPEYAYASDSVIQDGGPYEHKQTGIT